MSEEQKPAKKETEIELVTMDDGSKVEFAGKRKLVKESFVSDDGSVSVKLNFRNGRALSWTIPASLLAKCAAHGAEQKLGDETAGIADIDDQVLAVEELIERLNKGEWTQKREGNGIAGTSVLARALFEFKGGNTPMEKIREFLKGKSAAEKLAMRSNPQLKPIVEKIEAEKANGSKVDTDALLSELA